MRGHDDVVVAVVDELPIGSEFVFANEGVGDVGDAEMGVADGAAVSGKVLERRDDAMVVVGAGEGGGVVGDCVGIVAEGSLPVADCGALGEDVDVDDRGQVPVDPEVAQLAGGCAGQRGGLGRRPLAEREVAR